MKTFIHILSLAVFLVLNQKVTLAQSTEGYLLKLKEATRSGNFELIENTTIGTIAIQRAQISSQFTWDKPGNIKAGWYRMSFVATSIFQVIPERLEEIEPFIITIKGSENNKSDAQSSYAFKNQESNAISLYALPKPLLNPTPVQSWHSSQPLWIGENSQIEFDVRRPLLIVGDLRLEPVQETDQVQLTFTGEAPYNMFTDDKPVIFHYELRNFSNQALEGKMRFILKDALDGSVQTQTSAIKVKANGSVSKEMDWKPAFGAYMITAELVNEAGEVICSQHRYLTYSPFIDVKKLPDSWPVAFHRHPSEPEFIPPAGFKWIRLWGGWSEMEPEPGKYNWTLMDVNVRMAQENGFRLLWICTGPARWTLPDSARDLPRDKRIYTNEQMDKMRPFLHAFWQRYSDAGVIGAVEISNEPNAHPEWTPEIYARFARNIYEVTHEETEGVPVVGISMSGGTHMDYMEKALNAGLDKNMDIASLHLYEVSNPMGERSIDSKTHLFMQKLQDHGLGTMPVWNTESGSSTDIRQDGIIVSQEELNRQIIQHPDFDPKSPSRVGKEWRGSSELLGTAYMIRASYQEFAMGVEKNFIFQWSASPHYSWVYDWKPGGNVMPKIKVVATGVMSKMLLDYGPKPTEDQPTVVSPDGRYAFAHRFEGPKGRMTIVYVHPKIYMGAGDPVAALATGDDDIKTNVVNFQSPWLRTQKPEPAAIQIPVRTKQVIVMDMFGRNREIVKAINGFVEIEATEIPQYLIEETGK